MRRAYPWIYGAILFAVIADRLRLFVGFAVRFTDKDQAVVWTAAHELVGGRFHEPRFFGQAYSSVVEGWLAAPLVALGVPVWVAVPSITMLLALAPFLLLSIRALRSRQYGSALAIVALPLLLPFDYALSTSMPRGFVVGIALAALAAVVIDRGEPGARLLAGSFLAAVAVSLNPNALLAVVMLALLAGLPHWRSASFYRWALPGVAGGALLHGAAALFYRWRPERVVYGSGVPGIYLPGLLEASFATWLEALANLDRYFGAVTPILGGRTGFLGLIVVLLLIGMLRANARIPALALASTSAVTLASLALERVHLGSDSVSWPWSRPYFAVPLVLALALPEWERAVEPRTRKRWLAASSLAILLSSGGFVVERSLRFPSRVRAALAGENRVETAGWPVATVRQRCDELARMAERNAAETIVFQHEGEILAYACEPLLAGELRTLLLRDVVAERRSWRIPAGPTRKRRAILFYNVSTEQLDRGRRAGLEVGVSRRLHGLAATPAVIVAGLDPLDLFVRMGLEGAESLRSRARLAGQRKEEDSRVSE